jgi:hypothetical protein
LIPRCRNQSIAPRFDIEEMSYGQRKVQLNPAPPPTAPYPAEKARGGEISLNTPVRRAVFLAGLLGAVFIALLFTFLARM